MPLAVTGSKSDALNIQTRSFFSSADGCISVIDNAKTVIRSKNDVKFEGVAGRKHDQSDNPSTRQINPNYFEEK